MILVVFRTILLVQHPWTNLWKGRFINTNYYYYFYYFMIYKFLTYLVKLVHRLVARVQTC